jgi:sulfopyruvate decarboxylase alpha subunit
MDGSIYELLKQYDVSVVSHVPDAGHTALIRRCEGDAEMRTVTLTTEEEGIALAAGAWLGGARSVVLMQSSGVGNCCNLLALPRILAGPLLLLITMRGEWGEENPWQVPTGKAVPALLETCGVIVHRADAPEDVAPAVASALALAFASGERVAVLLGQRLLGAKAFTAEAS